ncbi:MAG: septum formation inhibitor Maf [Gammaproteobacteria bacterium]|nr:MAG: septum formation inhibitor Maf [Gammaproteobacteria bacterium]
MSQRAPQVILASRSPRRAELLGRLQLVFSVRPVTCDESVRSGEAPDGLVRRLAAAKAELAARECDSQLPVLGADTVVVVDGVVLGKPADRDAGLAMLRRLSGREHVVMTAVAVSALRGSDRYLDVAVSHSRVWFADIDAAQLERYWATGEGRDKAGGYGIQGIGGILVRRIEGSHSGIMGLPLYETEALLRAAGVDTWHHRGV